MPELLERKQYTSDQDDAEWSLVELWIPALIDKGWGADARAEDAEVAALRDPPMR
jgi:hypothetical protein